MAFFAGLFSVAGAVNQIMKFVNWARSRMELLGAYLAGYFKHQKQTEDAERDEREDARNARDEMERKSREERDDILAGDPEPDSMRTDSPVPKDKKSSDND